jgi:hypothetical protein
VDAFGNILATSQVKAGEYVLLQRFVGLTAKGGASYMRCCPDDTVTSPLIPGGTSLLKYGWADHDNDGIVSIVDLANVVFHFDGPDSYWVNPLFGCGSPTMVDICEVATVAYYFDTGVITHDARVPYPCSSLIGLDPIINPYQKIGCTTTPSNTPQGLSIPLVFLMGQWKDINGIVTARYAVEATGGVPVYTFSPTFGGTFPPGCTPSSTPPGFWTSPNGVLFDAFYPASCSPGTYSMTVKVADSAASTATYGPLFLTV